MRKGVLVLFLLLVILAGVPAPLAHATMPTFDAINAALQEIQNSILNSSFAQDIMKASNQAVGEDQMGRVMALVKARNVTVRETYMTLGIHRKQADRHMKRLHGVGLVHIANYRRDGLSTVFAAVFAWGEGKDAEDPHDRQCGQNAAIDEPLPIPHPPLGPWGCVW